MAVLVIESRDASVEIDPDYGARVLSLVDRRSGRDWLAKGPQSAQTGEDAVYLADEAVGWDECFPTVSPWDASATSLGRPLRDHGDLWGRPWAVEAYAADSVTTSRASGAFRFTRRLTLHEATLTADYAVANAGADTLPFMWALHGLLAVTAADRIEMAGVARVAATYISDGGTTISAPDLPWPGPGRELGVALDTVRGVEARFAAKLYASDIPAARASVGGSNGWLDLAWDGVALRHLGLWLNYGGWPAPGEVHHLALEPTTAPVDHLGQALAGGSAMILAPGTTSRWRVTMTLRPPASHSFHGTDR
jgi:galactose mutarotase-like enzyme